ncbi:gametocyte-specific factor 1 homolog [Culicoides brevitarsis]|uniref:gametocyte-specific factor 1 homolog n=1 Tax=Culicoides brevitarsis TaxID=469753 RepID=UPI00307C7B78
MYKNPAGFEDVQTCPYNPCHQILPHRMQTHLVKCAKQHPDIVLVFCPFNRTHRLKQEDMEAHKIICPNRTSFDEYVSLSSQDSELAKKNKKTLDQISSMVSTNPFMQPEESWDDFDVPTYNARQVAKEKNVLMTASCIGLTPAQRRQFYEQENQRLRKLDDLEPIE